MVALPNTCGERDSNRASVRIHKARLNDATLSYSCMEVRINHGRVDHEPQVTCHKRYLWRISKTFGGEETVMQVLVPARSHLIRPLRTCDFMDGESAMLSAQASVNSVS